jgi:hypothetical protein
MLAHRVGGVDRLRLAEIGDRLGAAVQRFTGEAAVVMGLEATLARLMIFASTADILPSSTWFEMRRSRRSRT